MKYWKDVAFYVAFIAAMAIGLSGVKLDDLPTSLDIAVGIITIQVPMFGIWAFWLLVSATTATALLASSSEDNFRRLRVKHSTPPTGSPPPRGPMFLKKIFRFRRKGRVPKTRPPCFGQAMYEAVAFKRMYYGYIKDVWSKDFERVVDKLSKLANLRFLIKNNGQILFEYSDTKPEEVLGLLAESVKIGAWHDLVNETELIVIFTPNDIHRLSLDVSETDTTWLRMKKLEPSIRKFACVKDMVYASIYGRYLNRASSS